MSFAVALRPLGPLLVPAAITNRALMFAVATSVAALLALYLALAFQLESPSWAATTVMIVAQPAPGQVVGKGFYRALGTVSGAIAAVVLMAFFAQIPELFLVGMAAWLAGCTYVSILLRGFRSYGAVLAGYTAAIVAFPTADAPNTVFDVAVARASAIMLGIVCAALVSAILMRGTARADLQARLDAAIEQARALVRDVALGLSGRETRRRLVGDIAAIEALADVAAAEDLAFRRRIGSVGAALAALFSCLSAARSIEEHVGRLPPAARLRHLAALVAELRARGFAIDGGDGAVPLPRAPLPRAPLPHAPLADAPLADADPGLRDPDEERVTAALLGGRAADALDALATAELAREALARGSDGGPSARLVHHRDPAQARRNALRAFIAVVLAGLFWIASGWSNGPAFVANVGVVCAIFAAQDRPSQAGISFLQGVLVALPLAFVWRFAVLPWGEGYEFIVLTLALPIALGAIAFVHPATARIATSFNVFFLSLIGITNVMVYDVAVFIDSAVATLLGLGIGVLVFSLVLPSDPARLARRILDDIRRDIASLIEHPERGPRSAYETLVYDRVGRVFALTSDLAMLAQAVAALGVALDVRRLQAGDLDGRDRRDVDAGLQALAGALSGRATTALAEDLRALTGRLAASSREGRGPATPAALAAALAAAATVRMIADAAHEHPGLFGIPADAAPSANASLT